MDKRRKFKLIGTGADSEDDEPGLVKRPRISLAAESQGLPESHQGLPAISYTIAWICAIPCELAAARAMLDETHSSLSNQPQHDSNHYTLGAIGRHNVVIACLPLLQYGTIKATNVLTNLTRTFPSVRACLMVGVGGGVPSQMNDIRLGDIVVGVRVMPYELGKVGTGGEVQHTGSCLMPHPSLSTLLSTVRAKHEAEPSHVPSILRDTFSSYPGYTHPGLPDNLFDASYDHVPSKMEGPCSDCDTLRLVPRRTRRSMDPRIHYGAIGSGDKLMKDGTTRDQLARKLDVMCFEMEAAGLMGVLPCLPIRGICDYSDSHKNKDWQRYAAAAAAAYARELMEVMPVTTRDGLRERPVREGTINEYEKRARDRRKQFLSCLQFPQLDARRQNIKRAHAKTCQWLLRTPEYQRWHDPLQYKDHRGFLWIRGKPGVGKSTMMKFLHESSRKSDKRGQSLSISFFFNARGESLEKSISGMYRSLLLQLLERFADVQDVLDDPDFDIGGEATCPPVDVLKDLFQNAVFRLGQRSLTSFVDALDEGDEQQIIEMVQFFEDLAEQAVEKGIRFKTCLSSRHYPYIDVRYGLRLTMEHQTGHSDDLSDYIRGNLRVKDAQLLADLEAQLVEKSRGVFLWTKLVVDILNMENRRGRLALKKRLAEIPPGLSELFKDILARDRNNLDDLLLGISWILFSQRPLNPLEYHHAIWAGLAMKDLADDDMPSATAEDAEECAQMCVLSSSKGLAEVTKTEKQIVQFIHESVRDFLIKDRGMNELWPDLGLDWEAQSHERLKQCCLYYLRHREVDHLIRELPDGDLIDMSFHDAEAHKMSAPLLEYASRHLLSHAEAAALAIPQNDILTAFSPANWVKLYNMFEKYSIRRYGPRATLIYILADRGLTNLIHIRLQTEPSHRRESGDQPSRYAYPLFAALARGNEDAFAATLGADVRISSTSGSSYDVFPASLQLKDDGWHAMHKLRTPLSWAASQGISEVVSLLLKQGADINEIDGSGGISGRVPLERALLGGHTETAQILVDYGARVSPEALIVGVESAAATGNVPLIKLMANLGADMNAARHFTNGVEDRNALYTALSRGHLGVVDVMMAHGAALTDPSSIMSDIVSGCRPYLRWILKGATRIKGKVQGSHTQRSKMFLFLAVQVGDDFIAGSLAIYLAKIGINVTELRNRRGETPLIVASRSGFPDIVARFLRLNANIKAQDSDNHTALWAASVMGHEDVVKFLISEGADIRTAKYPLLTAVKSSLKTAVRDLIAEGEDIEFRDIQGNTPLKLAAAAGDVAMVKILLESGADVQTKCLFGQSPLHIACHFGHLGVAKSLIEHGSNINATDIKHLTPLHLAVEADCAPALTALLLKNGAHVDARDNRQMTSLHFGGRNASWKKFSLLLAAGADVHARDMHRQSPLHVAAEAGNHLVVQGLLTQTNANVNVKDLAGQTPLHLACGHGHEEVVSLLVKKGADVNVQDDSVSRSPLYVAVEKGYMQVVRRLLETSNVNVNLGARLGIKPLQCAYAKGSKELVELLLQHGAIIDIKQGWGEQALSNARSHGHEEIAKLLILYSSKANMEKKS